MNLDQIIKLIDAGYSKEEIAGLMTNNEPAKDEPKADEPKANEPKANEPKANEPKKDPASEPQKESAIDTAIAKLERLSENMAKVAIMNSQQPPKEDINDYLARIIDPTYKKEEK